MHSPGGQDNGTSEPVQSTPAALPPHRVRGIGEETPSRTGRQGLHLLDAIRLDAVLPTRPRRLLAGDLRWLGQLPRPFDPFRHPGSAAALDAFLRQRTSARRLVRGPVLDKPWHGSGTNRLSEASATSSASRTSCSRWIPPPSRCAFHCSLGPSSAAPKGA